MKKCKHNYYPVNAEDIDDPIYDYIVVVVCKLCYHRKKLGCTEPRTEWMDKTK